MGIMMSNSEIKIQSDRTMRSLRAMFNRIGKTATEDCLQYQKSNLSEAAEAVIREKLAAHQGDNFIGRAKAFASCVSLMMKFQKLYKTGPLRSLKISYGEVKKIELEFRI